jgi:hypothetical protein
MLASCQATTVPFAASVRGHCSLLGITVLTVNAGVGAALSCDAAALSGCGRVSKANVPQTASVPATAAPISTLYCLFMEFVSPDASLL